MIHLIDNFYLSADDRNYILHEWTGKTTIDKKGNEKRANETYWYYNDIESMVRHMLSLYIRRGIESNSNVGEISELYRIINNAFSNITPLCAVLDSIASSSINSKPEISHVRALDA